MSAAVIINMSFSSFNKCGQGCTGNMCVNTTGWKNLLSCSLHPQALLGREGEQSPEEGKREPWGSSRSRGSNTGAARPFSCVAVKTSLAAKGKRAALRTKSENKLRGMY